MLNTEFNQENLQEIYVQNKQLLLPILGIAVSVILLLFVVIPQIFAFPSNKAQADQENVRLGKMQDAYDYLSSVDPKTIDSNLIIAQSVLPDKKDFESVLNAITFAAGNSSTQIINYNFQDTLNQQAKFPTLIFKIEVAGGVKEAVSFINELYKTYPLSSVMDFSNSDSITSMDVVFYYRAFPPITPDDRLTVNKMNKVQESALKAVSAWVNSSQQLDNLPATPSSTTTSPF